MAGAVPPTLCALRGKESPPEIIGVGATAVVGQRSATPEAAHHRVVFTSALVMTPNILCICHLPENRSEAVVLRALCPDRIGSPSQGALGATASDQKFGR